MIADPDEVASVRLVCGKIDVFFRENRPPMCEHIFDDGILRFIGICVELFSCSCQVLHVNVITVELSWRCEDLADRLTLPISPEHSVEYFLEASLATCLRLSLTLECKHPFEKIALAVCELDVLIRVFADLCAECFDLFPESITLNE